MALEMLAVEVVDWSLFVDEAYTANISRAMAPEWVRQSNWLSNVTDIFNQNMFCEKGHAETQKPECCLLPVRSHPKCP